MAALRHLDRCLHDIVPAPGKVDIVQDVRVVARNVNAARIPVTLIRQFEIKIYLAQCADLFIRHISNMLRKTIHVFNQSFIFII